MSPPLSALAYSRSAPPASLKPPTSLRTILLSLTVRIPRVSFLQRLHPKPSFATLFSSSDPLSPSRQELSNGMLGFNHALKIHDTPFPFPYVQLITLQAPTHIYKPQLKART
jgi:hypothetical protein